MAELGPIPAFFIGMLVVIAAILIFYFFARTNKNAAGLYREAFCSGIL